MLQEEIKATVKRGCYSGMRFTLNVCYNTYFHSLHTGIWQVAFLAGCTGYPIQQHCETSTEGYESVMYPCRCSVLKNLVPIHMCIRGARSNVPNHIMPLLPSPGKYYSF